MASSSTSTGAAEPLSDGRRARGARSREAVVDAILDLLNEGTDRPNVDAIAERSGVSVRSIFRHFDDLESLYATAVHRHLDRVGPLFAPPAVEGPLDQRIDALVQRRAELFEAIGPVRRTAERLRGQSEVINERLEQARRTLRRHLTDVFAVELGALGREDRAELLDALEQVTSWRAWNTLRVEQGVSVRRAGAVMARTVRALWADAGAGT